MKTLAEDGGGEESPQNNTNNNSSARQRELIINYSGYPELDSDIGPSELSGKEIIN